MFCSSGLDSHSQLYSLPQCRGQGIQVLSTSLLGQLASHLVVTPMDQYSSNDTVHLFNNPLHIAMSRSDWYKRHHKESVCCDEDIATNLGRTTQLKSHTSSLVLPESGHSTSLTRKASETGNLDNLGNPSNLGNLKVVVNSTLPVRFTTGPAECPLIARMRGLVKCSVWLGRCVGGYQIEE